MTAVRCQWRLRLHAWAVVGLLTAVGACTRGPTADEVLDRMMSAIDTRGSRGAIQSLTATAEGTGPEGLFVTTVTSIPPGSLYFRQDSGAGSTEIWSTPENTWGGRAGETYKALGPEVRDFVRGREFHLMLLDIRSRFSGFELAREDVVRGKECLRISMTDQTGADASICVGTDEWLPLELQLEPESADGPVRIEFDDWRVVDGLNFFHSAELIEDSESSWSYEFVNLAVNEFATEMRIPAPTLPRVREDDG